MRKILNILFIIIVFPTIISAQVDPQSVIVSYKCINKPLPIVLKELSKSTGVNIVFSESKLKEKKPVTISATNERLVDVLRFILKPSRLTIEIIGNSIAVVSEKFTELDKDFTISGYVKSAGDGEVLPYATVFLNDHSAGVYANEKGFYSFKLKRGNYSIVYSYIGFIEDSLKIFLKRDTTINAQLKTANLLTEVLIEEDLDQTALKYGEDLISRDKIAASLLFAGEADVIKAVNSTAGVSSASDGFGGLSVRGGNYDQNLILFDGVPVQNTGHAFGLISIFNSSVIQDARLIKGGFPARYGGRLSSVLDVKTREGNKKNFNAEISISTIASKAVIEGPIKKDKASFILSYRRTFADPWIREISRYINKSSFSKGETSYFFDDFNAKLNFNITKKHQLILSYYAGRDKLNSTSNSQKISSNIVYTNVNNQDQKWGNGVVSIHLNSQVGNNMFSKLIAYQSIWQKQLIFFQTKCSG